MKNLLKFIGISITVIGFFALIIFLCSLPNAAQWIGFAMSFTILTFA